MKVLSEPFTDTGEHTHHFNKFPFELDSFQKHAIVSMNNDQNVLVTAFTGSGKTLVAEYAIMKSLEKNKKIIYTSPIKSLSNQKFYEFKQKFPEASLGIMTGDIKFNPFGNIIIMTTEILRNMLYKQTGSDQGLDHQVLDIDININKDIDTVVFDEIHYINDVERGKVWEECIILLPKHIKLVLLSATIDKAEEFASWLYQVRQREICLIPTFKRYVPLKHYFYLHGSSKDGTTPLDTIGNKLIDILDENGKFYKENYEKLINVKRNFQKYIKKQHYSKNGIFNPLVDFLVEKNLCPALFFVFSRAKCEQYALCVNKGLLDTKDQCLVEKIITQQLMKLPDYNKYLNLEQFIYLKKLLLKGVAVHHSGLIPVFKELIEILFSQKLVKVLFATETFAVGVNMPTKTVLFTELSKRDNSGYRLLLTQEYTQMSGRAGRRGLDKVGYVIHLPNLFDEPSTLEMEKMLLGKSQHIKSKFTIDYQFVLKMLHHNNDSHNDNQDSKVIKGTLLYKELTDQTNNLIKRKNELETYLNSNNVPSDDYELFSKYLELKEIDPIIKLNKKSEKERLDKLAEMEKQVNFKQRYNRYLEYQDHNDNYAYINREIEFNETYVDYYFNKISEILSDEGYINIFENSANSDNNNNVNLKGIIASKIGDCNPILLTELISNNSFDNMSEPEIAATLSIFLDTKVEDNDNKEPNINNINVPTIVKNTVKMLNPIANKYIDFETANELYLNIDWTIHLGMMEVAYKWANLIEFKNLTTGIFEGNFVKDMVKLDSICQTVERIADLLKNNDLVIKIKSLKSILMRDIVSIDSLYIL